LDVGIKRLKKVLSNHVNHGDGIKDPAVVHALALQNSSCKLRQEIRRSQLNDARAWANTFSPWLFDTAQLWVGLHCDVLVFPSTALSPAAKYIGASAL
jgi:hypothetical protein